MIGHPPGARSQTLKPGSRMQQPYQRPLPAVCRLLKEWTYTGQGTRQKSLWVYRHHFVALVMEDFDRHGLTGNSTCQPCSRVLQVRTLPAAPILKRRSAMAERQEHCAFARCNRFGRCVAVCFHNVGPVDDDCTGLQDTDNPEYKQIVKIGDGEVHI